MIGFLRGSVKDVNENEVTVLNNGIGFAVYLPYGQQYMRDQEIELYIEYCWHQETGPTLYGFATKEEKLVFQLLTSCSGIGPKLALSILAKSSVNFIIESITHHDATALSTIPGIGKKKAEHMIVQLSDAANKLTEQGVTGGANTNHFHQISEVLTSLHYSRAEVQAALDHVKQKTDQTTAPFDVLLRQALSFLSKHTS